MPADELVSVVPGSFALDPWTQKSFVPAFEVDAIATGHQQPFGDRPAVPFARFGTPETVLRFGERSQRCGPAACSIRPSTGAGFVVWSVVVASLDIACRKADQQMRRTMIRLDLVCIELFRWRLDIAQVFLLRPVEKVRRHGSPDGTMALRVPIVLLVIAAPGEVSPIRAVVAVLSIPEREVLRVERSVSQDRFVAHR